MWYWIMKVSILSFIFIFLLHYLYSFFVSTLTVPKVKDLVTLPQEKYEEMFHSLQPLQSANGKGRSNVNTRYNENNENNNNSQSMKEDLINFLKDIGSSSNNNLNPNPNSNMNTTMSSLHNNPFDSINSNVISSFSFSR